MDSIALYDPEEVAKKLKLTRRTIYTYIHSGKMPAVKIGHEWRVREDDLNQFIEKGTA